jgi:phosphomannomutase/phosphoglucomutase
MKKPETIPSSIFREYDIRGIAERDLSTEFAQYLGLTYAEFLKDRLKTAKPADGSRLRPLVAVGRDCRLSGEAYSEALIQGLRKGGLDVVRIGVCPTPLTYFSVFHLNLDGAIMVTGSHNPANYNGFKICAGKDTLHGSDIQNLRVRMESGSPLKLLGDSKEGSISDHEIIPDYIAHVASHAEKVKKARIVLDAGNGTAGSVAPELFRRLGAEVIELFCELDGRFPNHHPDPTVPANLKHLIESVKANKADFGIAFDGDSDRIGLVDESGRILFGDELMVILSRDVLKHVPGATIISEVKSSHRLYLDIAAHGGKPIMWKTGHSLIKSKMKETGAALAGEMSGHIFFSHRWFGFDDAIYAATRIYEIYSRTGGTLSALIADLPQTCSTPEIRIDCDEDLKFKLVEETRKRLEARDLKPNTIDGVRIDTKDGWGLLRASNTQPVLVLRFEATTEKRLGELRSLFEDELQLAAKSIGHAPIDFHATAGH